MRFHWITGRMAGPLLLQYAIFIGSPLPLKSNFILSLRAMMMAA